MKFHINKKGTPTECKKNGENCKLGPPEDHFETLEEAERQANELMTKEFDFIPNVHFASANVPSENVIKTLSNKYSELYVIAKYLQNNEINPVICLGKDEHKKSIYHCVYEEDELFYDINGIIATDVEKLKEYISKRYNITNQWIYVDPPDSVNMIENLIKIDIQSYGATERFESYINKMQDEVENSDAKVLEFIRSELK